MRRDGEMLLQVSDGEGNTISEIIAGSASANSQSSKCEFLMPQQL